MQQIYHFSHKRLITKRPKTECLIIVHIQCLLLMVGMLLGKRAFGFNLLILLFNFKIAIHLFDKRSIRGVTSTLILYAKFHYSYSLLRKKKWTKQTRENLLILFKRGKSNVTFQNSNSILPLLYSHLWWSSQLSSTTHSPIDSNREHVFS
jgi:hypothetical protein